MPKNKKISIIGAGGFGTAIASVLAGNGHTILIWDLDTEVLDSIKKDKINHKYLPNIKLPENIYCANSFNDLLNEFDYFLIAVPSHVFEKVLSQLNQDKIKNLIWVSKGLANDGEFLSQKVKNWAKQNINYGLLSGPSFAKEIAQNLPAAVVAAADKLDYAAEIAELFSTDFLKVIPINDLIGAQIGAVIKNIIAVACGIADGLNLGSNARAAIITAGMLEMKNLGSALGAKNKTLYGLSGMGDVILTCTDNQSRNRQFGLLIAKGIEQKQASGQVKQVVEAEHNIKQVYSIAQRQKISMPVTEQVYKIIQGKISPKAGLTSLFTSSIKIY